MTGYYEPEMEGSLEPDPRFPVPLYGLPADLHSVDLGRFHPRWKGQRLTYRQNEKGIAPYYSRELGQCRAATIFLPGLTRVHQAGHLGRKWRKT